MYLFYRNLIGYTLELHCDVLAGEALESISVGIVIVLFDSKARVGLAGYHGTASLRALLINTLICKIVYAVAVAELNSLILEGGAVIVVVTVEHSLGGTELQHFFKHIVVPETAVNSSADLI